VEEPYDISNDVEPEWEIVALENTDDCIIANINGINYRNGKYYVFDENVSSIFIFDSAGTFVSKLYKKGGGPDEYSRIDVFCLEDKNIWISDGNMRWLICYDENLKMTERFRTLDSIGAYDIKYYNGNIYMATNWSGWNEKNMQLGVYNIRTKEVTGLWYVPKLPEEAALWRKQGQLAQWGSSCLFFHSYCDTIFQIDGEGFSPKYRMIFSERYKDIPRPIEEYMDPSNNDIKHLEDIKRTQNKIFIIYLDGINIRCAAYDIKSALCKVYPWMIYSGITDNFEVYPSKTFFDDIDNSMICVYDAGAFLEFFGKESDRAKIKSESYRRKIDSIVSSIDEYSNHIVIKFKFKPDSKL
jgi:Fe-S-cluster containining protein